MKQSTVQNLCIALHSRGALFTTISQVAKVARVSKSTAHRFFAICEQNDNLYVEYGEGKVRRIYTKRYDKGVKAFHRGLMTYGEADLRENAIIIRRGGII